MGLKSGFVDEIELSFPFLSVPLLWFSVPFLNFRFHYVSFSIFSFISPSLQFYLHPDHLCYVFLPLCISLSIPVSLLCISVSLYLCISVSLEHDVLSQIQLLLFPHSRIISRIHCSGYEAVRARIKRREELKGWSVVTYSYKIKGFHRSKP